MSTDRGGAAQAGAAGAAGPPAWRRAWVAVALVALLGATALAYAPSLGGDFVYDDERSVLSDMSIRRPDAVRLPAPREMLGTGRPLTAMTFALDWRAEGLSPRRFHATGLALHLAAVLLAFAFVLALLRRVDHPRAPALALVVAGLFALHPVQVESVAYVSQRAEVLSGALYLAALLLLDASARRWLRPGGLLAWAGGVGTWVLAMGAKAVAVSLPGAVVLDQAVVAPAGESGGRAASRRTLRALLLVAPIALLAAWSAVLQFRSFAAMPGGGAGYGATPLSGGQYLLTQLRVQWLYLRLLAWPDGFSLDRGFEASRGLDGPSALAAAGVAALVTLALWLWVRAERGLAGAGAARLCAFGILFWFVALAPTSSVVPVADLAVEHRVYLATLGPFLAGVVAVDALVARWTPGAARVAGAVLAVAVLLGLGLGLRSRAEVWSSAEGIWREALRAAPGSERILTNLGIAQRRRGDLAGAEQSFRRAWTVARRPEGVAILAQNHAELLLDQGRAAEALALLDRGVAAVPGDPIVHVNRAVAFGMLGRDAESLAAARRAVEILPGSPVTRNTLGVALCANGAWLEALPHFRAAEALDPGNPMWPVTAAISLTYVGRRDEACATYRRARATTRVLPLPRDAARNAAALGCPIP